MTPEAAPRVGRWLIVRAAIAAVVIVLSTAGTVAALALGEIDAVKCEFLGCGEVGGPDRGLDIPEVSPQEAGGARTVLVIGSDRRYADRGKGNSDTLLLMRVDPAERAITVTSIPRDLKVDVPGHGRQKVNAAYAIGGERLTVSTIKRLLARPGEPFGITNVVNVNFGGFRRAIDYIGGVYVDVDRSYLNDNAPPTDSPYPYATIDVKAGYQRLEGRDALDYVRYRHTDNDLVRAARQQDFLRQLKSQPGARKLLEVGERKRLARIFSKYIRVDRSLRSNQNLLAMLKLAIFVRDRPVRQVPFRVSESGEYLTASDRQLAATLGEFMEPKVAGRSDGSRRRAPRPRRRRGARRREASRALAPGLVRDRKAGEDMAIVNTTRAGLPFYFPTVRTASARYVDAPAPGERPAVPRLYSVRDQDGRRRRSYRIVAVKDRVLGQYYGITGTTWKDPPILANPSEERRVAGRTLELFYDGRELRVVAWRTARGAYWVTNTLANSLSNRQMLAIAASLTRLRT